MRLLSALMQACLNRSIPSTSIIISTHQSRLLQPSFLHVNTTIHHPAHSATKQTAIHSVQKCFKNKDLAQFESSHRKPQHRSKKAVR
jgi:hypothetical protein